MIIEYAESLAARLAFDPVLARRVRAEVEDHLREAAAADGAEGAERRAIERFGDARAVASQLAAASLAGRLKDAGVTLLLALAAAFLAMELRLAWYEFTDWGLCEQVAPLAELIGAIDRSSLWVAALLALAGRAHARRRLLFCSLAAACIALSVASDGVLTFLRLADWDWSSYFLVPLASMAIEAGCAALLALRLLGVARLAGSVSALERA